MRIAEGTACLPAAPPPKHKHPQSGTLPQGVTHPQTGGNLSWGNLLRNNQRKTTNLLPVHPIEVVVVAVGVVVAGLRGGRRRKGGRRGCFWRGGFS